MVDVSVIVPAFNAERTIKAQLEALRHQRTSCSFEVLVADNGSRDATVGIVEEVAREWPALRLLDASGRQGSAHARNVAAECAQGAILAFCDADDVVSEHWLSAITSQVTESVMTGGPLLLEDLNTDEVTKWRPPRANEGLYETRFLPFVPTSNMSISRSDFIRVGRLNENYPKAHDVEFSWRAQLAGMQLRFVPEATVQYRYRSTLRGAFRQAVRSGRANVQLYRDYRKHGVGRRTTVEALRRLAWLVIRSPLLTRPSGRGTWVRRAGESLGQLVGSMTYRVWCP